jgi:hypothetical protein
MADNSEKELNLAAIIVASLTKFKWIFVPSFLGLGLIASGLLSLHINEFLIQILSVIAVLAGLPLSAALRVDQLSFNLGSEYSREWVLLISLIIAFANLTILLFLKRLIFRKGVQSDPKTNKGEKQLGSLKRSKKSKVEWKNE